MAAEPERLPEAFLDELPEEIRGYAQGAHALLRGLHDVPWQVTAGGFTFTALLAYFFASIPSRAMDSGDMWKRMEFSVRFSPYFPMFLIPRFDTLLSQWVSSHTRGYFLAATETNVKRDQDGTLPIPIHLRALLAFFLATMATIMVVFGAEFMKGFGEILKGIGEIVPL